MLTTGCTTKEIISLVDRLKRNKLIVPASDARGKMIKNKRSTKFVVVVEEVERNIRNRGFLYPLALLEHHVGQITRGTHRVRRSWLILLRPSTRHRDPLVPYRNRMCSRRWSTLATKALPSSPGRQFQQRREKTRARRMPQTRRTMNWSSSRRSWPLCEVGASKDPPSGLLSRP